MDWVTVAKRGARKNKAPTEEGDGSNSSDVAGSLIDMKNDKRPMVLVVDTAAIIKGLQLGGDNIELYTVPQVLDEVRDKKARHLLDVMPFELKTREPSAEHVSAGLRIIVEIVCL